MAEAIDFSDPNWMSNLPITFNPGSYGGVSIPLTEENFEEINAYNNRDKTKTDAINKMRDNIIAQGSMDKWSTGSGLSKETAAQLMAGKMYEQGGITRLEDFGKIPVMEQVSPIGWTWNNQDIKKYDPTGQYYYYDYNKVGGYDDMGNPVPSIAYLTSAQAAQIQPTKYGYSVDDGEGGSGIVPVDPATIKNVNGVLKVDTGQTVYGNKVTGQAIPVGYDRQWGREDIWGGTFAGDSSSGFGVYFNELGMPMFYTKYDLDNSWMVPLSMLLTVGSFIPGVAPFAMAAKAALAASQGDTFGAVLSALGAANAYGQAFNTLPTEIGTQSFDIDTLGDYAAAGVENTAANWLATNAGTITSVTQGVQLLNALDKKNLAGIIGSLTNIAPQIGITIPEDVMKPIQYAVIGSAASKGDWTGAALAAATMTNNSNVKLASSGLNLVNAFKSGNPSNILMSMVGFAQQAGFNSSVVKDTAKQAGLPLSDVNANKLMQSTIPSETDSMINTWLSEAKTVRSNYEKTFGQPISDDLLEQLNGEAGFVSGYNSYINSNAGQVDYKSSPAGQAAEADRVEAARVEADRVEAARIETARVAAEAKAAEQTQNIKDYYKQVLGREATPDELKNFLGEFGGVDKAIEEAKKRTTVAIGNAEADNPQEAAALAKIRDPYSTQFTYGGNTYSMAASNGQIQQAYKDAELTRVSNSKTFDEAFAAAKDLKAQGILGANEAFTWNGQSFNTNLAKTATEASAFDPNTVFKAKSSLIEQLADTKSWQGANLSSGELAKFTDAFAKATPEQRASMLKGSDAATYKIINDALTTTRQATDATQIAIQNGTLDLTKPVTATGSISESNATNYLGVVKNIGNNIATDLASTALGAANLVGTTLGFDTSEIKNLQKFMSDDQKKQMSKLVGQEKYAAAGLASGIESIAAFAVLGPTVIATLPMVAFAVNNAWVEGANSWVATDGKVYDSKEEAIQAAGKDNIRQLTTTENTIRAALMGGVEMIGEKFGLFGMSKLMKSIPLGGTAGDVLNAAKNFGLGMASEQISEAITTLMQMGVDKFDKIGLGQNSTWENVKDALVDTMFTTAWAVGGSSTIGSAVTRLQNVSTDPIPQFQSPVLPEDVWARAKDAGVSTDKINALKAEAFSLSSVGEITKITSEFKDSLAAAGFTPQEIQRLTAPAITDSVNTSVVSLLKASGVPAGQIADVAKQATSVLMSGGEPTAVARNLLDVFYANNIDPIKANTMAADYTGLMTPAQVSQAVKDAIAANPTITPTQLETAISNAAKNYATAADIKSAISGITFPAGLTSTDVTNAITAYMTANPGLSIKDVATSVAAATKDLATSSSVNTSIGDALKGYATTQDIKDAISGIKFPAGLTSTDVTTAIKNYMTANPGLSLSDVSSKITEATKNLATTSDVKDSIGEALKGYATAADVTKAISNIKFPEGITAADVTSAITNYMKANPGLSLTEVANAISTATTGLASNDAVKASINAALKDVATTSDISAAISGIKFPAGLSKDDVTASIKAYMAANPGLSLADVSSKITEATKDLATSAGVNTSISDALKGYATTADIKSAIAGIKFPTGLTTSDVTSAISSYMKDNPGLSISDVASKITDVTKNLATTFDVKDLIGTALKGYATTSDINAAIAGIKFPAGITPADVTSSIKSYMQANPGLSLADVAAKVSEATKGLATDVGVTNAISAALKDVATTSDISAAISGIKFPTGLTKDDVTSSIKTYMQANPGLSIADVASKVAEATKGLATSAGVTTSISEALKGYATTADINKAIAGIQFPVGLSKSDVAAEIKTAMDAHPGLSSADVTKSITDYMTANPAVTFADMKTAITDATKGFATKTDIENAIKGITFPAGLSKDDVSAAIKTYMTANPGLSLTDVASKITDATKGLATSEGVTTAISNAIKGYATTKDIETAISNIKFPAGLSKDDVKASIADYMKANPGLSLTDVATKITDATKSLATTEGTKTAISDALKGYATSKDIDAAIGNIKFPAGLSKDDVSSAIKTYMTANPGLSLADVASEITKATTGLATSDDVKTSIGEALKGYATAADITNAIKGIKFPVGITPADVTTAITNYMKSNPGLSIQDVASAITAGTSGLATDAGVKASISDALNVVATSASLAATQKTILDQVAANESAGMTRDAALQSAISTVAALQKTDTASLTDQMSKLNTSFGTEVKSLKTEIDQTEKDILAQVAVNEKAGMTRDAALQKAINTVAATQKIDATTLTDKMTTMGTAIGSQINAVKADLAQTEKNILAQVAVNEKAGMTRDAALQSAINTVAASQKTDAASLTAKISGLQTSLGQEIATQVSGLNTKLTAAIDSAIKAGQTGDAALQTAINKVSSELGTTKANLLSQVGKTEATLTQEISAVQADLAQTEKDILAQVAVNEKAGMTRDAALQSAINTVAATQKTDAATLTAKIAGVQTALGQQLSTQISGLKAQLSTEIAAAVASGLSGDAALQKGLDTLSAKVGTNQADILSQLGKTTASLKTDFTTQLSTIQSQLSAEINAAVASGLSGDAALQKGLDTLSAKMGTNQTALLTQLGKTTDTLKADFSKQLAGVTGQVSTLQTGLNALSGTVKTQYDSLTQAQKDAVASQVQQGKDLTKAISDTATGLQTQITGLSASVKAQYDSLTQAQKDAVAAQAQQGKDFSKAITDTATGLQTQITGLSAETKAQYDALTQAQKDSVALQTQQGKDLTKAITDTAAGLQTQVTGLSTDLQTKYDALTQGQKDIVNTLTQQGVNTVTAINEATKTTTEQISTVKTDLTKNITNVQTQFNTRVDELMKQGTDYQTATQTALKELGTGITGLQTGITDIKAQQADAAEKAAAATKASRAGIAQSGIASNLAKAAAAVGAGAGAAALVDDSIPGYKDIGLKTTGQTAKFESVLSPFQQMVEEDNKAKQNEQQNQQQNQQGASMSENLNIENPKSESDYFNYGYDSQIDQNLSSSTPQFYKSGGLATPLFAGGGTTRHGRFAGGGLNVVEHSGKARLDFRTGNAVTGPGDGQSDDIPAMLADGEFVFPADVVAALGNGSTKAGSDKLYDMMHSIRAYHRSAKPKDLPPPAKKSPLDYLKKTANSARR